NGRRVPTIVAEAEEVVLVAGHGQRAVRKAAERHVQGRRRRREVEDVRVRAGIVAEAVRRQRRVRHLQSRPGEGVGVAEAAAGEEVVHLTVALMSLNAASAPVVVIVLAPATPTSAMVGRVSVLLTMSKTRPETDTSALLIVTSVPVPPVM